MAIVHPGMSRSVWVIFLAGIVATIVYATLLLLLVIFPGLFAVGILTWVAEHWGEFGGIYIVTQVLPIVSRPLNKDAWEITDNVTSYLAAAIVFLVFPIAWGIRTEWPSSEVWRVWRGAIWISVADVLLTLVAFKISRAAGRLTNV